MNEFIVIQKVLYHLIVLLCAIDNKINFMKVGCTRITFAFFTPVLYKHAVSECDIDMI